ncbi:Mth938-like domain-containing protein [Streptomonospora litoralis]|uniref:Mth938-like domain-containing protein n=1 Tax=Streptomonospora litoralis TaxID=2498135 RepID=UPI001A9552F0|nr:Mth938-like domain-containing protein [Streptomonospora litoralis]
MSLSWGRMEVEGVGTGKDFKLHPAGGRPWDWNETGTRHSPGVLPADVEELLDRGAAVVVLSRGMQERLGVDPRTLELLESHSIEVHTAETTEAVRIYNALAPTRPAGGLFHSTC